MDAYVEAVDGVIVLKSKKLLVEEGDNEFSISGPQKFMYKLSDTVGEGHGSNRGKSVIDLSTGEVPALPETGNDIILDSDGKIRTQYVLSKTDPNFGDGTRGTMAVTLNENDTSQFVAGTCMVMGEVGL